MWLDVLLHTFKQPLAIWTKFHLPAPTWSSALHKVFSILSDIPGACIGNDLLTFRHMSRDQASSPALLIVGTSSGFDEIDSRHSAIFRLRLSIPRHGDREFFTCMEYSPNFDVCLGFYRDSLRVSSAL